MAGYDSTLETVTAQSQHGRQTVVTGLTLDQAAQILSGINNSFSQELVNDHMRNPSGMSPNRKAWLLVKAQQVLDQASKSVEPQVITDNMGGVLKVFEKAKQHLKFPKIRLQLPDGSPVVLSVAGSNSRNPGSVVVNDGGRYPSNRFYGYLHLDGSFSSGRAYCGEVGVLLREFAIDPAGVSSKYGKSTGSCCFCGLPLTNGKGGSASVGYGPDCADHWGLPWKANGVDWVAADGNLVDEVREVCLDEVLARARELSVGVDMFELV